MQRIWQAVIVMLTLGAAIAVNSWRYPIVGQMAAQIPAWEFSLQPKQAPPQTARLSQNPSPASQICQMPSQAHPTPAQVSPTPSQAHPTPNQACAPASQTCQTAEPPKADGGPSGLQGELPQGQAPPAGSSEPAPIGPSPPHSPSPQLAPSPQKERENPTPEQHNPPQKTELSTFSGMLSEQRLQQGLPLVPLDQGPASALGSPEPSPLSSQAPIWHDRLVGESSDSQDPPQNYAHIPPQENQSPFPETAPQGKTPQEQRVTPPEERCTGSVCGVGSARPRIIQVRAYPRQESSLDQESASPRGDKEGLQQIPAESVPPLAGSVPASEERIELLPPVDPPRGISAPQQRYPWPPGRVPFYPSTSKN